MSESIGNPNIQQLRLRMILNLLQAVDLQNNHQDILNDLFNSHEVKDSPISDDFLESLTPFEITTENESCSICLEELHPGDNVIKLPCKDKSHYFHIGDKNEECDGIYPWLQKNNTCPVCRCEFPKKETPDQPEINPDQPEINPDQPEINPERPEINPERPEYSELHQAGEDLIGIMAMLHTIHVPVLNNLGIQNEDIEPAPLPQDSPLVQVSAFINETDSMNENDYGLQTALYESMRYS